MHFIFDVDDTLYDQCEPFLRAITKLGYDALYPLDYIALFTRSRAYSEEVFAKVVKNEMSIDESGVYRIKKAFLDDGVVLQDTQALAIQVQYRENQSTLCLSETMQDILKYLVIHGHTLGVITNGPYAHQQSKIDALQLHTYIPQEHIVISGQVQIDKPNPAIFQYLEDILHCEKKDTYFIGDSYENDVLGAIGVGWNAIYFNRRGHQGKVVTHEVSNEQQLFMLLKQICKGT